jgi:hypothetical protein
MFDPTLSPDATQKLALQTRKGGVIDNAMNPARPHAGLLLQIQQLKLTYSEATHRDVGPSARYNCHGLTFASRRTGIYNPAQVQKILTDDGYRKLDMTDRPVCGDIAVYLEDGDVTHSGIVAANINNIPWILGKWGECHEVIHPVNHCPYHQSVVSYYRLMA